MSETPSQRAMSDVDKVAEAICREHRGPIWCEIPDIARQQYRRMAVSAMDALGLREQWADADADGELDEWACGHPIICGTRQPAVHEGFDTPMWRLVTSWQPTLIGLT